VGVLAVLSFALIHFPFGAAGMIFITLWVILPVFLFLYYDNIYPGYLMHALGNLWAFLFVPILFGG
jgi:membrane protease YdiL (CAAX protease family)